VSLLSYCRCCPLLDEEGTLGQLQGSFSALLGDSNELTQVGDDAAIRRCSFTIWQSGCPSSCMGYRVLGAGSIGGVTWRQSLRGYGGELGPSEG
jgi:hypothetical protein